MPTVFGNRGTGQFRIFPIGLGVGHRHDVPRLVLTEGKGVPVVYDGVGAATYEGSLKCLSPFGYYVSFGAASGPTPPVPGTALAPKALYYTRPGLAPHTATPDLTQDLAELLFGAVRGGVKIEVNQTFALKDAADAHRALEGRQTTGSTLLLVD